MNNYWLNDTTRKEIITKTHIPNEENFNLFANYYNIMDKEGLGFQFNLDSEIQTEKLFRKNSFEYLVLEHNNLKELFILPNENIVEYTDRIVSKLKYCKDEIDVLNLIIEEM